MNWHEGTVFLKDLAHTVFIGKFQAVLIQEQCDLCTNCILIAFLYIIFCSAITGPVYRLCTFCTGKSVNVYFICYHKCRIETKSEMTDDLVICCLVFIFLQELGSTGKSDLSNIFLYFLSSHTNTIINEFQSLLIWVYNYLDLWFIIVRECIFPHYFQFLQFGNGITSVGYQLSYKDIVV